jgi:hypothetical protein
VWVIRWRSLRNAYRVLARKPEEKGSLRKPTRMWNDNVRMDVKEIGFWGTDWINLTQDAGKRWALENTETNIPVL